MLRSGAVILTVWCGLIFLPASFSPACLFISADHSLLAESVFSDAELAELSRPAVAAIRGLAVVSCAAFSSLVILVVRASLARGGSGLSGGFWPSAPS